MKRTLPIYLLLFCLFPLLSLYAHNINELSQEDLLYPAAFIAGVTLLLWAICARGFRDAGKSGAFVSFLFIWFFAYGHIENLMQQTPLKAAIMHQPMWILIPWAVVLAVVLIFIARSRWSSASLTPLLNLVSIALVVTPIFRIATQEFARMQHDGSAPDLIVGENQTRKQTLPDIFYIVLDGYARADTLKDVYRYDNTSFLDFLRSRDFQIAGRSCTNYCQTLLSLASTLNYEYLDEVLGSKITQSSHDRLPLKEAISNNKVISLLKQHGYTTIALATGYDWSKMRGADMMIDEYSGLSSFNNLLLSLTPLSLLHTGHADTNSKNYASHRKAVLFPLNCLSRMTRIDPPIFVYSHILAPHPPFVFTRDGKSRNPQRKFSIADASDYRRSGGTEKEYLNDYREQLIFLNGKVKIMIANIIAGSTRPTIIILQSDHGPGSHLAWDSPDPSATKERMRNLCAIRFPPGTGITIPDEITPVNTFRIIFNQYFGMDMPLLENRSYYSSFKLPYTFNDVTATCSGTGITPSHTKFTVSDNSMNKSPTP